LEKNLHNIYFDATSIWAEKKASGRRRIVICWEYGDHISFLLDNCLYNSTTLCILKEKLWNIYIKWWGDWKLRGERTASHFLLSANKKKGVRTVIVCLYYTTSTLKYGDWHVGSSNLSFWPSVMSGRCKLWMDMVFVIHYRKGTGFSIICIGCRPYFFPSHRSYICRHAYITSILLFYRMFLNRSTLFTILWCSTRVCKVGFWDACHVQG
jgi:hypothetical protein